ncbi:MAG: hypothetical protein ACXVNF_15945 [Neobacillus sp.]
MTFVILFVAGILVIPVMIDVQKHGRDNIFRRSGRDLLEVEVIASLYYSILKPVANYNVLVQLYKKLKIFKSVICGVGYKIIPEEEIMVSEYNYNIDSFIKNSKDLLKSIYNENIIDRGLTQNETEDIIKNKKLVLRVVTELHKQKDVSYKEVDIATFKKQIKYSGHLFYYFSTESGKIIAISNTDIIAFQRSCGVTKKSALAF